MIREHRLSCLQSELTIEGTLHFLLQTFSFTFKLFENPFYKHFQNLIL